MNPWQLAKDSESSQQVALFCWVAKAYLVGFNVANQPEAYKLPIGIPDDPATPELRWFHHIPNGGSRGDTARSRAIEGGKLKAEGVRAGVLDCFWPLRRYDSGSSVTRPEYYCGLYIEMKKPDLKHEKFPYNGCSQEQRDFGAFVSTNGYRAVVCYTWLEAAKELQSYYELGA